MNLPAKTRFLNSFRRIFQIRFLERGLANLTRGKLPNHPFSKLVPNPYQYKKPTFREIVHNGIRMRVDISDYIGHYYFFGFEDPAQTQLFGLCQEDYNVLDIGANIGFTVLKFAKCAPKGKVVGFEPDPVNFSACTHNLSLNNTSATVLNIGLGEQEQELHLELRSPGNRGGNRIAPQAKRSAVKVKVRRLDNVVSNLELDRIDLVKIDVEGYELRVLKGAEQTLRKYKPILFIEVDDDHLLDQGDSADALINFIRGLGYHSIVTAVDDKPITSGFNFAHCHFDIVAT